MMMNKKCCYFQPKIDVIILLQQEHYYSDVSRCLYFSKVKWSPSSRLRWLIAYDKKLIPGTMLPVRDWHSMVVNKTCLSLAYLPHIVSRCNYWIPHLQLNNQTLIPQPRFFTNVTLDEPADYVFKLCTIDALQKLNCNVCCATSIT